MTLHDAVVVGSGPNGLAAAVTLARAGLGVLVLEEQPEAGGGSRTLDLGVAPGLRHDVCSAVHPMAAASPFFRSFDLAARGVELRVPEISYAHPLDDGRAGLAYQDLERTAQGLGADGAAWRGLLGPLVEDWPLVTALTLGDHRSVPRGTLRGALPAARLATGVLEQGTAAWDRRFTDDVAPALLTGVAAHAVVPLPSLAAAGTALLLATLAHGPGGWPLPVGGSGAVADALVADLLAHGGELRTGRPVRTARDLPPSRAVLFDTSPRAALAVLGDRVPPRVRTALQRHGYGAGVATVHLALSGPVPWTVPDVGRAGTVHVAGSRADAVRAEADVAAGRHAERPVVLLSDPTVTDPARAVGGLHPVWAYAHVPAGSTRDVTEAVLGQLERFAPGVRDLVVAARCTPASRLAEHDANLVGGDVAGGAVGLGRLLLGATRGLDPYGLGEGAYLCSASTTPGPGVHGMVGWHAAVRSLRRDFDVRRPPSLAPDGVLVPRHGRHADPVGPAEGLSWDV